MDDIFEQQNQRHLIDIANEMSKQLADLGKNYDDLLSTIKKEYAAVSTHKIDVFEMALSEKKTLSSQIDRLCSQLKKLSLNLHEALNEPAEPDDLNLSATKNLLERYIVLFSQDPSLSHRLIASFRQAQESISEILRLYQTVFIEIKKNRHILGRLLYNHQQSYRFWQEICGESASSYNEKGNKSSKTKLSQFSVKA